MRAGVRLRVASAWGVCALLAACSATATGSSAPAPSGPATVSPAPEVTSTYAARRPVTIPIDNPDGMVAVAGSLFVKTDDGRVVRVNPVTNKVTGEVKVDTATSPDNYCQGIGTDGRSVWACSAADDTTGLVQVDPATLKITWQVPVGKVFDQLTLPATGRGLWVLTGDGSSLTLVSPASRTPPPYPLGVRCQQVAALGDQVVTTGSLDNTVVFIDASTGKVTARVEVRGPRLATIAGSDVWVDSQDGLVRLAGDGTVRTVYRGLTTGPDGDITTEGGAVLLRTGDGTINRIEASSGRLLERISPDTPLTGGGLLAAYGSLWLTSNNDGTLTRLRV